GRPAPAGADRASQLRSGHRAAVHRSLRHPVCPREPVAQRSGCGEGAATVYACTDCRCVRSAMTAAADALSLPRRSVSPWLVAVAVVIPTFMEVLDTTIANVALRYIAGGLSSPATDSEWVITSYLAANAIILPISGWLALRLGRRNYFLLSIAMFTLASALCGMGGSLTFIIASRGIQGVAGGGLPTHSQAVFFDVFQPKQAGKGLIGFV